MRVLTLRCVTLWGLLALASGLGGCSVRVRVQDCCPPPCAGTGRIAFDIPPAVHAGVLKALPGFVASEMEIESEGGRRVYEFEGSADGVAYEIEVDEDGNVLEIESGSGSGSEDHDEDASDSDMND